MQTLRVPHLKKGSDEEKMVQIRSSKFSIPDDLYHCQQDTKRPAQE